jgi:hypothetical protein
LSSEFAEARLGDERRTARLQAIAEAFGRGPGRSIPEIAGSPAALEGLYRFVNSDKFKVSVGSVLQSHSEKTAQRCQAKPTVLVIHDGSDLVYPLETELRDGFGRLGNQQGIQALVSLAVAFHEDSDSLTHNDDHEPLGVVACQTWAGPREKTERAKKRKRKKSSNRKGTRWGRLGAKDWDSSIVESQRVLGAETSAVHVIDREGDTIELFARLQARKTKFVIRVMKNRRVAHADTDTSELTKIAAAASELPRSFEETVEISRRSVAQHQTNPPRSARKAILTYAAGPIWIKKGSELGDDQSIPPSVTLNFVHVKERDVPDGEEPIEWFLVTSEPIETAADVRRVVRIYRARWLVEELFRVLKTGCAIEKRQVESRQALEAVLAISLVVAWRILVLRYVSRLDCSAVAEIAFKPIELDLLRTMYHLPDLATVQEALLAVARLGGHLKSNGPPGNVVLARGLEKLDAQAEVWAFARSRCD